MPLQAADIGDLVTSTLRTLGRGKYTDLTGDLQDYPTARLFLKQGRVESFAARTSEEGYEFSFTLMLNSNGSARSVGLGATDIVNIKDVDTTATHPFRHFTCNYGFELREPAFNAGKAEIFNLVKQRRIGAMIDMIKLIEKQVWRVPAVGSTDMYGIPYWIVKSGTATTTNNGFNGITPSGFSTVAGIDPNLQLRWRNFAAPYTNVTVDDLVVTLDLAMDKTLFVPPVDMPTYNTGDHYTIMTTQKARAKMKQLALAQNDNLGFDLDAAYNRVMFRRVPIDWVPQLDEDTTDPFYGINWGELKMAVMKGWWMRDTDVKVYPGQHTVAAGFVDNSCNTLTRNRRRHFVISNGTTMPA